ncbi:ATP-binding protein [Bacillus nitratireducens]|uniref:AAA family ATPase n=1 Tax=Bacillus nitratireducens TaxID=2026193 RepID=UPI001F576F5E|nr:AAA family ATPase [Bacillus nitratireducens]UNP78266.1 ATP-binding protein [Bacillus nitratireducens]
MQILYLWINRKNGLNNISLNFGGELQCNVTNDNLIIEDNTFYIKNFFSATDFLNNSPIISSVTGIAGENGTGKSTILNSLMEIIETNNKIDFEYLIFYQEEKDYYFDYSLQKTIYYDDKKINNQQPIIYNKITFNYKPLNLDLFSTVFFSNIFDIRAQGNHSPIRKHIIDLSTNSLYNDQFYLSDQIHSQIIFTKKYEHNFKIKERINIPKEIQIEGSSEFIKGKVFSKVAHYKELVGIFDKLIYPEISNTPELQNNQLLNNFGYSIYLNFYINTFDKICNEFLLDTHTLLINFQRSTGLVRGSNLFADYYKSLVSELQDFLKSQSKKISEKNGLSISTTKRKIEKLFKSINSSFIKTDKLITLLFKLNIKENKNEFFIPSNDPNLLKFINAYNDCAFSDPLLKMYWSELSSGEYAFLSLFSRFNSIIDQVKENLIILIDEGDIYFHPQWQKDWLYTFLDIISYMYRDTKIQIVLTTHSPFILSDLPSNNVIFLKKNQDNTTCTVKNLEGNPLTFAANIHDLLTNSFFMHDGLVGKFAQHKINNLVDEILDSSPEQVRTNSARIRKQIDIIGEPIVKRKLIEIFEDKIKLDLLSINEKIKQLQQQIDELKAIKDDKS